ncbi:MAG: prepilin peptidase [Anaerolineales bacterium]|nr:prepilin peptidase [Anaerolineales bacterium]
MNLLAPLVTVLLGLFSGMLVNYLADILPVRRRFAPPICLNCGQRFALANYLFWPRRCEHCHQRRTRRMWVVEILGAVLALWLVYAPEANQRLGILLGSVVLIYFAMIVVIDYEHRLILHPTSWFGVLLGLVVGIKLNGVSATLLGGAVGYGVMYVLYYLGALFTKLMARLQGRTIDEVALGFGDVNLTGVLGLMVGWPLMLVALFLSVLTAGLMGGLLLLSKMVSRKYRSFMVAMPYGPFLILGAFLMLFLPMFTQELLSRLSPIF